ncbi:MAG TPA: SIMPL domain-containing protein, partial [Allosphingosinicella sp.]|nr:SIMPL domain-containing protein [Allosphingosinicella sp.]
MRLAGVAALAVALACPQSAAAQAQVQPQASLATGETLLEIASIGTVRNKADTALLQVTVKSDAASAAEARSANAARVERVKAAARASGVEAVDPSRSTFGWQVGFIGNAAPEIPMAPEARPSVRTETAMLEIRINDFDRIESVRGALERAGADKVSGPIYELADSSSARRAARRDA